ncbi:MAG: ribosomal RNA small subunit methyltransferase A [Bacilli bacterium]|nr:ribosomal RNA small subunit methyltransferase A [Bacilli bacterium]MBQ6539021.1 ribosomal RNA small subunit methyltransferase A [Bacilli bacterium]
MEKYDIKFKKRLGQNFLKDKNIVKRIVDVVTDKDNSLVIEVGPGGGILTRELCQSFNNVLAYEIDDSIKDELDSRINEFNNIEVIYKDFLKSDISKDIEKYKYDKLYFISNVPYYITSPIILKLINSKLYFNKIVMMVQKEVGDRYTSKPGNKTYGAISVILQYFYNIKKEFIVSKGNFIPVPKVDSVVVSFEPIERNNIDIDKFIKLVNDAFQFKRKILKNNLKNYDLEVIDNVLNKYGYNLNSRAEELSVEIFIDICNQI